MTFSSITTLMKSHLRNVCTHIVFPQTRTLFPKNCIQRQLGSSSSYVGCPLSTNYYLRFHTSRKSPFINLVSTFREYRKLHTLHLSNYIHKKKGSGLLVLKCTLFQNPSNFHTTSPKKAVPPIILLVLRPFLKFFAAILGRSLKKWWAKLTPAERKSVLMNFSKKWAKYTGFSSVVGFGSGFIFYVTHLEIDPLTGRKRFIMFSESQTEQLAQLELNQLVETYKGSILPATHPLYKRVVKVAQRLILANMDIKEVRKHDWEVTVVESEEVNAFVLPVCSAAVHRMVPFSFSQGCSKYVSMMISLELFSVMKCLIAY